MSKDGIYSSGDAYIFGDDYAGNLGKEEVLKWGDDGQEE